MYETLKELCGLHNTTITALCVRVTGDKGNLRTWKKGYMRSDWLLKCAEILHTSTDFILTGKTSIDKLSDEEVKALSLLRTLSESDRKRAVAILESLCN